ncbi:MAG: TolC family protein [Halanaerobacter sp.]
MKQKIVYLGLILLVAIISTTAVAAEDMTKEKAVEMALEQNSDIQKLEREIAKTKAQLGEAEGAFYPSLDLNSSYTRFEEPPQSQMAPQIESSKDNYTVGLDMKLPIYLGGELRTNLQLLKNQLRMSKLNLEQKKEEITYQVLEEYHGVLQAKKMLKVREQQVKQNQRYVEVAEANKEAGVHTKTDLLRAKVSYNQAQQEELVAENNFKTAKLALKNTLNLENEKELKINDNLDWQQQEFDLDSVYEYALEHKVAFKILDLQQENAELDLEGQKKKNIYPDINLSAGYEDSADDFSVDDGDWQTTLSLSYNLFNGGRDKDKIKQKSEELKRIKIDKEQTADDIKIAVEKSLLDLRAARDRIKLSKLNLEQAEENLADNESKFNEGIITSFDLLEVQTTYQDVQTQYYQAIYDYNLAVAELNKAIGKLETEVK